MPNEKDFKFDKNKFTSEMLDTGAQDMVSNFIDALSDPHNRDIRSGEVVGYNGAVDDASLAKKIQTNPDRKYIYEAFYEFYKNPEGPVANQIKAYWGFIKPVFHTRQASKQEILAVLYKIDEFDEDAKVKLLRRVANILENAYQYGLSFGNMEASQMRKDVLVKLASCQNATLQDKSRAVDGTGKIDIIRDAIEMAKTEIDAELKKDFPDARRIVTICGIALSAGNHAESYDHEYAKQIREEFDSDKVLAFGPKYVQHVQKSLEEEIIELKRANTDNELKIKKQQAELDKSNGERDWVKEKLTQTEQKNNMLSSELNELQRKIKEQEYIIKNIKLKVASQKVGLIGGGAIKEIQDYVKDQTKNYGA